MQPGLWPGIRVALGNDKGAWHISFIFAYVYTYVHAYIWYILSLYLFALLPILK